MLSSVHATSTTCSMCWTSLCAACLYVYYSQPWLPVPVYTCVFLFFCDHTWIYCPLNQWFDQQIRLTHARPKHALHAPSMYVGCSRVVVCWTVLLLSFLPCLLFLRSNVCASSYTFVLAPECWDIVLEVYIHCMFVIVRSGIERMIRTGLSLVYTECQ